MSNLGLNLGCGNLRLPDKEGFVWINMDNDVACTPEVLRDVLKGIPYSDNTFDTVFCSHFLEHFGGQDFIFIMNEIHRVLKVGGELRLLSPFFKFWGAWTDPNHRMFFNEHSFEPWWFPSMSSWSMGIKGFYHPVVLEIAEEKEIRVVMRKVAGEQLQSYTETVGVKNEQGGCFEPNWQELLKGTKFFVEVTDDEKN